MRLTEEQEKKIEENERLDFAYEEFMWEESRKREKEKKEMKT